MIGATELRGGLYILNHPHVAVPHAPPCHTDVFINFVIWKYNFCINFINQSTFTHENTCNIWKLRLCYPSYDKLIEIKKTFHFVQVMQIDMPCDVCFYAKQNRWPFPHSSHKFVDIFDLVHMDIWGPLSIPSINGHK